MTRCVVTGGAGFIGSHLVEALVALGWEVTVFDNLTTGKLENLATVRDRIRFIESDIRDPAALAAALAGAEVVFHLAALVSVPLSMENPRLSADINDLGTLGVLSAARDCGARRVIFSSSAAVYGNAHEPPHEEGFAPDPASPYAAHKLIGEHYCRIFSREFDLETVSLRYFNVYGPRQDPKSPYSGVISIFADRLKAGQAPLIYGDGLQTRDFVYVGDVARANIAAATRKTGDGSVFNVGTGKAVTVSGLWEAMASGAGSALAPVHAEGRQGEVRNSVAATRRASETLGFAANVALADGLAATLSSLGVKTVRR